MTTPQDRLSIKFCMIEVVFGRTHLTVTVFRVLSCSLAAYISAAFKCASCVKPKNVCAV